MASDTTYSTLAGYIASGICFAGDEPLASMSRLFLNKNNLVVIGTNSAGDIVIPAASAFITINVVTGDITAPGSRITASQLVGDVLGNSTGINIGSVQALSGAGAVNVTTATTKLTTTGNAQALTLADAAEGQFKTIVHVVDGGSAVLTPTTKTGFSTITFTAAGDSALLQFFGTVGWNIIALNGASKA